ncbi:DUF6069 family protein [Actinomadura madurae]|uniref:DUF6069 family protein n=1 Tax=Actinomadura madurae TaxID=1993 RepID=UPI002026C4FC|nr:DUF6069 family protein [Actinomadura madurae]MCP9951132.1 DUF6069 family protein [Actinomadura madurae]MCP9967911.1 DUF6069 family protein [Actinomadura madurae]MCP9980366.1 DUF6069 family protein [Actinomadura madurae]MCQ0008115.1 DUF6069 family protein [Actinomadura madurae]MCQ0016575.1 DUF6069 family protein [Actinomadura madurae]
MTTSDLTTGLSSASASVTGSANPARGVPMWRTALVACVGAAVATTVIAAVARGAGVALEIEGEPIPLMGFTQLTLLFSAIGVLLAVALRRWAAAPKRTFLAVTGVLLALSVVPDLLISATTGTKLTLIATHLVAAAIVIPLVAGRLPGRTR